ncbi:MAG: mandelate racemase/muconate lactonizing enzyme family protein [Clostridia bacterium]|nr:mandelate racemase/muconate lactonizing enzyme family protein [Clostridia bacterium]
MRPSAKDLKITDIRFADIDGLPKHMILLKIYTNSDIVGYGEVRDASSATYAMMLKGRLLGENPLNIDKLFQRIKQFGGHSRQGGGVSGIEVALWDIAGKYYGVPVYQLLGGQYRDKIRIYCDTDVEGKHTGRDMGKALKRRMEDGFTYLKMDLGIELLFDEPGTLNAPAGFLDELKTYSMKAISHQSGSIDKSLMYGKNYEIFTIPHHATGIHITEKGLDYLENYVKEVREEIGYEIPLAIDHIGHVAVEDAIRFAGRLEKYNIAWMEDIAPWMMTGHLRKFAENSCVPLGTGEDIYLAENFRSVLEAGVNLVHPDVLTIGGLGEIKKLGDLCETYGAALALHMAESPIGFMAAVHAAAALKNVLCVEFHSVDHPEWYTLSVPEIRLDNGFMAVPDTPGLGIEYLNEELIEKFHKKDCPAPWSDTSHWNGEWSNDRIWS